MDDLEFRRTIYADPNCDDQKLQDAAIKDPSKQDFWAELRKTDANIKQTLEIKVPEDLAHKLILRQTIQSHNLHKKRNRMQLALAASIAFAVGVSFTLWQQQSYIDLTAQSLAHVYHEGPHALQANENFSLQQVNVKLAQYGAHLSKDIGQIYYANHCEFDKVKSLHMVMQGQHGRVTVFVVPHHKGYQAQDTYSDGFMTAQSIELRNADLVVVGENIDDVKSIKGKLQQQMIFSA